MSDQARGGRLSPFLQERRLAAALPHLRGAILDYGCGNGELYGRLAPALQASYVGYDLDAEIVRFASRRWPGAIFLSDTAALADRQFDTVVSLAVIEHVPDVKAYLVAMGALLRSGGRLVITSPNGRFDAVHRLGAQLGLFSLDASNEHNEYVTGLSLARYCRELEMELVSERRFLLGANQLFVLRSAEAE